MNKNTRPELIFGKYTVDPDNDILGQGATAIVYRGRDDQGNLAAIKVLNALGRPVFGERDWKERRKAQGRALREVKASQVRLHPGAVRIYEYDLALTTPNPYIAMELVSGPTLGALAKEAKGRGGVSPAVALKLMADVADVVAAMHKKGVSHRDLKPDNVILSEGRIKVLDFGLAKAHDDAPITEVNGFVGTPTFMAPERIENRPTDPRLGDVYSLGAMLQFLMDGETAYDRSAKAEAPNLYSVALWQLKNGLHGPEAKHLLRSFPSTVQNLIEATTHEDPYKRISAKEFAIRARRLAKGLEKSGTYHVDTSSPPPEQPDRRGGKHRKRVRESALVF